MNNKVSEKQIVEELVLSSSYPVPQDFKANLEDSLKNKLIGSRFNMKKLLIGGISLLSLTLVAAFAYTTYFAKPVADYDKVEVALKDQDTSDSGDASMGMKLAVDDHDSLSSAQNVLKFTMLKPAEVLEGKLARIQTARTFDGSKSDALYVTFAKDGESYFKVAQMAMDKENYSVPTDATKVELNVAGETVNGYYIKYEPVDIDPNSEAALYEGDIEPVRGAISFYYNGVAVEVSEMGKLSKDNLIAIVESM